MENVGRSPWWLRIVVLLNGGLCVVLGLAAMVGWHWQTFSLLQAAAPSPPIYYNTAVGFLLCGTGLLAVARSQHLLAQGSGGLAAALGAATLGQYLFGVDLGIDQIVVTDTAAFANPYPGRMAPTSALGFALSGAALLLLKGAGHLMSAARAGLVGVLGVVVTQLGLATLLFYATGLMTAYGLEQAVNMSLPAAVGFTILGVAIIVCARVASRVAQGGTLPWLPALVGVGAATVALLVGQALLVQEYRTIEQQTRTTAAAVSSKVAAFMDAHVLALVRLGKRWEHSATRSQPEWESEAGLNLQHFGGYVALAWVDPTLQPRWVVSRAPAASDMGLAETFAGQLPQAVAPARDQQTVTVTRTMDLGPDGKGCLVFVPLVTGEYFDGLISGMIRFQDLFDLIFHEVAPGYALTVFDGTEEIYRRAAASHSAAAEQRYETIITPYGVNWRLHVWPTPALLAAMHSPLPLVALGTGLCLALLLALSISLGQTAQQRAYDAEITNRQLQQEMSERQRAEEKLRQSERLAAMGTAAATLAHEIANPLNGISTTVQILERSVCKQRVQTNDTLPATIHDLKHEIGRLQSLLTEWRALARPQQLDLQPTSLATLTAEVLRLHAAHYAALAIGVQQAVPTDLPLAMADHEKIAQVLLNLCKNAVEAMPNGGTLTVGGFSTDAQVSLTISDTGVGIPAGRNIFEPFATTKRSGTGLGLAIAQQIVAAHGGTLSYRSTEGHGTTFTLTLPTAADDTRTTTEEEDHR